MKKTINTLASGIILVFFLTTVTFSQLNHKLDPGFKGQKNSLGRTSHIPFNYPEKIKVPGENKRNTQTGLSRGNESTQSNVTQDWASRYNSPDSSSDFESYMAIDGSGNVYVTGVDFSYGDVKIVTIKYNPAGDSVWVARYFEGGSQPFSIAVDGSGNVYVNGVGSDTAGGSDYLTIKYNSAGEIQWVQRYNGPANDEDYSFAMALDASGNIYVTGLSFDIGFDFVTIKYNSAGTELWVNRYSAATNFDFFTLSSIAVDASGNAYTANTFLVNDTSGVCFTIKINSSGIQQWAEIMNGTAYVFDQPNSVAVDNSGNVFVTGITYNIDFSSGYATVKYNSAGVQQWLQRYENSYSGGRSVKVDNAGNIYVTGEGGQDYVTIKYDTNGDSIWVARYGGIINSGDAGFALALDGGVNVYVTGISSSLNDLYWEYATVKYNSSGVQQWVIRYAGSPNGNNFPNNIEVGGPAGFVYVSGTSDGDSTHQDFATIRYSQDDPQPVELSSFTSIVSNRDVTLSWSTASEINNSGFDIERRDARREMQDEWNKIGFVQGNGTSTSPNSYSFTDKGLNTGKYNYRLKQIDLNGNFEYFNLSNEVNVGVPSKFELSQNYPNPFNPSTKINYDLPYDGKVSLKLFDISGREVATLVNEFKAAGYYTVTFNGANLSSGIYFYRLNSESDGQNFTQTKRMTLIK
jgi:hypothetical protein